MPKLATPHIGAVLHHSARNILATATPMQERARIAAIDRYHKSRGYRMGFAYHFAAFPSGNLYRIGDLDTQRAHVARKNHLYMGIVVIGDYTCSEPTERAQDAVREALELSGPDLLGGHREFQADKGICPGFWDYEVLKHPKPEPLGIISAQIKVTQAAAKMNDHFLIPMHQTDRKRSYELRIPR